MKFYLGTHAAGWLAHLRVPLFVSHRRLQRQKRFPVAVTPWALDSGGYTELRLHGGWALSAVGYAATVRRYRDEIGMLEWAAPQDWMCERDALNATGLTVADHQRRTVDNFLELRAAAPDLTIIPVLQGWTLGDYLRCVDLYEDAGVDLAAEPVVGLGSVCRRQDTTAANTIVVQLASRGLNLHGFGVKINGLGRYGWALGSADSLAWSYGGRLRPPLPGCTHKHCGNCQRYALAWHAKVERAVNRPQQTSLALGDVA